MLPAGKLIIMIIVVAIVTVGSLLFSQNPKPIVPVVTQSPIPHVLSLSDAVPAYQGLDRIRFMAWSPDDRLFLTDMKNLSDNEEGKIYILENFDEQSKQFKMIHTYLSDLRNPNSIAFHDGWLYVALTDKLVRYPYKAGDNAPSGGAQTLILFPDYGLSYKYGGWHLTRTVVIHNNKVYVSVGSSCNSCEEKPEEIRAEIIAMDLNGDNQRVFATGLRNAVGLKFVDGDLWATDMGADHLGDDKPNDRLIRIKEGANYGWPYCYEYDGMIYADESKSWEQKFDCSGVPISFAGLPAHSAPLGLETWGDGFLVALHGSGDISVGQPPRIVFIDKNGMMSDFITGFQSGKKRYARPADILKYDDNSFLFTDDHEGTLYYVYKK